jgi:hypothetical protein
MSDKRRFVSHLGFDIAPGGLRQRRVCVLVNTKPRLIGCAVRLGETAEPLKTSSTTC